MLRLGEGQGAGLKKVFGLGFSMQFVIQLIPQANSQSIQ
jgi:hypothetical protein